MMRCEFDALLEAEAKAMMIEVPKVGDAAWQVIETVYMFHPLFDQYRESKKACVDLFLIGGMSLMIALLPKAVEMDILYRKGDQDMIEKARQEVII